MPKVTLSFNLPEEREEYEMTLKASSYYCTLHDLYQLLRTERKHGEDKWASFETEFWRILKENEVEI
jgi:hypothetical protein